MYSITVFTRPNCHLCHEAEEILLSLVHTPKITKMNIEDSEKLEKEYGIRIPVIKNNANSKELDWPFGPQDIMELLQL